MSKCISSHGEYSSHENDEFHVCKWCGMFDEAVVLKKLEAAEAERDAAVAAIERLRAIHREVGEQLDDAGVRYTVCEHCTQVNRYGQVRFPCPTIQALDGAPEPEWEWAVRAPGDDEPFSDAYQSREHLAEQETGIAWGDEQLVRRRKAGPWLPVEGESKT